MTDDLPLLRIADGVADASFPPFLYLASVIAVSELGGLAIVLLSEYVRRML